MIVKGITKTKHVAAVQILKLGAHLPVACCALSLMGMWSPVFWQLWPTRLAARVRYSRALCEIIVGRGDCQSSMKVTRCSIWRVESLTQAGT
jgi:hypothetical protein